MDVGGSHVTAALVVEALITARADSELNPHGSADEILSAIAGVAEQLGPQRAWTLAFPGPFDYSRGVGTFEGVGKFAALANLDLGALLAERLGAPVSFVDDADAYGQGEWLAGAARGHARAICITLGTGVGASFLVDGYPQASGHGVPPGGNLYPFDYLGGPIEDTVSTRALLAAYDQDQVSVREIFVRARAGEASAALVVDQTIEHLGRFVAPFIADFGAAVFVVGGSISQSWDLIEPPLRRGLGDLEVMTARSELLDDAPLVGAALWARRHAVVAAGLLGRERPGM
jgi:glucokinase